MPVGFLTLEQERRYGRFNGTPTREQLDRFFHLDDVDLTLIGRRRWEHMRLGFAVQLGTVRFLGTFLSDPSEVPSAVTATLAQQIGIADPGCLVRYRDGKTRWQHAAEIRQTYGYREFAEPAAQWRLLRWLYALCWTGTDRPTALFDQVTAWLIAHKVLLPGQACSNGRSRGCGPARIGGSGAFWRHGSPSGSGCGLIVFSSCRKAGGRARWTASDRDRPCKARTSCCARLTGLSQTGV